MTSGGDITQGSRSFFRDTPQREAIKVVGAAAGTWDSQHAGDACSVLRTSKDVVQTRDSARLTQEEQGCCVLF